MGWWKADPVPEPQKASGASETTTKAPPIAPHPISPSDSASACPVDEKTRSIWLQAAKAKQQSGATAESIIQTTKIPSNHPPMPTQVASSKECSSDRVDQSLPPKSSSQTSPQKHEPGTLRPLSSDREISTIPRGYPLFQQSQSPTQAQPNSNTAAATTPTTTPIPSNAESETGHDKTSGNWIYPSETQFFNAVMRKQTSSNPKELASSISSIIPIHNAVNERAWHMIRSWEGPSSDTCGGPKLLRFEGKGAGAKSPRAVMKSWSGYTEPFDRHDWTVQRCDGTEVEYVIDFYQGKAVLSPEGREEVGAGGLARGMGGGAGTGVGGLNFYLDVRPKLNSFEGCKMRFERAFGWR